MLALPSPEAAAVGDPRWVAYRVGEYVATRGGVSESWRRQTRHLLTRFFLPTAKPPIFERLGFPMPVAPRDVTRAMVDALGETDLFLPSSRQNFLSRLHGFLAWSGNPIAADPTIWRFGKPEAFHRRWVTLDQGVAMLRCAQDSERVVIALGLLNGLRAIEIARLRVRDAIPDGNPPVLRVMGKGRGGGKPRLVAMNPMIVGELRPFLVGKSPEEPVYPKPYSTIYKAVRRAAKRAGLGVVGTHDLRRSFGSIAHDAGTPVEEIQAVYGHASPAMTTYYIGVDIARMARGLSVMARYVEGRA